MCFEIKTNCWHKKENKIEIVCEKIKKNRNGKISIGTKHSFEKYNEVCTTLCQQI